MHSHKELNYVCIEYTTHSLHEGYNMHSTQTLILDEQPNHVQAHFTTYTCTSSVLGVSAYGIYDTLCIDMKVAMSIV